VFVDQAVGFDTDLGLSGVDVGKLVVGFHVHCYTVHRLCLQQIRPAGIALVAVRGDPLGLCSGFEDHMPTSVWGSLAL
jgi:hypothetical protein